MYTEEDLKIIKEVMRDLNYREQRVLTMRYGLEGEKPKTLEQVAEIFNVSPSMIHQMEYKAIRKLRHPSRLEKYKETINKIFPIK